MKKLVCLFLILLLLSGCTQEINPIKSTENMDVIMNNDINNYEYEQRDLLYRIYDGGIKLQKGVQFQISEPNIKLQDESKVSIWVINLETNENREIMDYDYPIEISFIPDESGTYLIYALIENKDSSSYLDLTKQESLIRVNSDKNMK